MKKISLIIIILNAFGSLAFSQNKKPEAAKPANQEVMTAAAPVKDTVPEEIKVYRLALSFSDYGVAKQAIYDLIAKYPERIDYMDTLAALYFSMEAYPQCLAAAGIVLKVQPENMQMMELFAVCQNAMKNPKEALEMYEKIYAKSKSLYHLYEIAVLQYTLQRYGECNGSIEKIIADKDATTQKLHISYDEQNTQEVPYAAAVYNLRGVMEKDLSQKDKAKADFEEAIKIFPEFKLAKNNLDLLTKPAENADKGKEKKK